MLITIGIIGVVAAMTLPSLMQKIQHKEFESRYKVAENLIHNAVNYFHSQGKMIYGDVYCTANATTTNNYCADGSYEVFSEVLSRAFTGIHALNKNGNGVYAANKYYTFKNNTKFDGNLLNDGYMELKNGMSVIIETGAASSVPIIFFDLNGSAKNPNRMGYDTFAFVIDEKDRVCPLGSPSCRGRSSYIETTEDFTQSRYCSPTSGENNNGLTCSYFASIDKDYFKKIK